VSLSELRVYAEGTDPARYSCDVEQPVLLALLDVAEAARAHRAASECSAPFRITRRSLDAALDRLREETS
jgi:hypothetical protein